jgi:hypothetical protein
MAAEGYGQAEPVAAQHQEEPQFCLCLEADWVNYGIATWKRSWHNAFTPLGPIAAACLSPPDGKQWHAPMDDGWGKRPIDPKMKTLQIGDIADVKAAFSEPTDLLRWLVGEKEIDHQSTLHLAFERGDVEILQHLLQLSPKHFMEILTMAAPESCYEGDSAFYGGLVSPLRAAIEANRCDAISWMCESGVMTDTVFANCGRSCAISDVNDVLDSAPIESALAIAAGAFIEKRMQHRMQVDLQTRDFIWTSSGIDHLIEICILTEPGKAKVRFDADGNLLLREGEMDVRFFDGAFAGAEVTALQKNFLIDYAADIPRFFARKHLIEEACSDQKKVKKSKIMLVLEQWQALPDVERKGRSEALFADLIWPVKKIISVSSPSPAEVTCKLGLSGDLLTTIKVNQEEDRVSELLNQLSDFLGESVYSLSIVSSSGKVLTACDPTELLCDFLS